MRHYVKFFFPGRVRSHFFYCCASIYFFSPNYLFLNHSIYSAIMMLVPYPYYTYAKKQLRLIEPWKNVMESVLISIQQNYFSRRGNCLTLVVSFDD